MHTRSHSSKKAPFIVASILCIALIAGVTIGWLYYFRSQQPQPVVFNAADPVARQQAEGREETVVTPDALSGYTVAADLPRVLSIESIGVRARVLPMGINPDNSLQAPINIYDSGWYNASAKPGQPGASVIDAHASGPTRQGLFAYLDTMKNGDRVKVERGDGQVFEYEVVAVEKVGLAAIDMEKVVQPYEGVSEGLNLITCTGQWLKDQRTYDQRAIVYTKRVL